MYIDSKNRYNSVTMESYYRMTLCLWVFTILLCNTSKCFGCLEKERIGLLELGNELKEIIRLSNADYYAHYYDLLSFWGDEKENDCCAWYGVQCNNSIGQVIQLSLTNALWHISLWSYTIRRERVLPYDEFPQLDLSLNASLFLPFEELQQLDLSYMSLTDLKGLERLSKLEKLHFLDLQMNHFNNSFLASLNTLTSLKTLNLSFNYICDESFIQDLRAGFEVLSNLQKLEELVLEGNNCNNSILPFLGVLGSLKTLDLSDNNLEGSSPEFSKAFTNMSSLEVLDLEYNGLNSFLQFHDSKNMSKLKVLYLGENNFARGIPPSISTLNSLQALSMPHSNLSGPIPSGLCELQNLRAIDLSANKFEGILPPCFNNLTSLRVVDFSINQLHIPSSLISNMNSLEFLSLSGNQIDGNLAFTSPLLSNQLKYLHMSNCNLNISTIDLLKFLHNQYDLRSLHMSDNNLHGSFPNWLVDNNTRLQFFDLRNNSLTGNIQLGVVDSLLIRFDVSNNHIQGKIQTDIGVVLSNIVTLNLSKNSIEGSLPSSLANVLSLMNLDFSNNNLSGVIPESWGLRSPNDLNTVILSNNRLHGPISPNLLTTLYRLRLSNNQFSGNIPSHVDKPCKLVTLDLSQNHMSGIIPSWIGQSCPLLNTVIFGNNSFHGPIPPEFCNSSDLKFLDLSHNHLFGSLPTCLNLTSLNYMHLQGNKFSGIIPKAIVQSSNLITLDLRQNNLSGTIPRWFGYLRNLRVLLLKGNHLRGSISRQLCQLTKILILDLSNNNFSGSIPPCLSNMNFGKNRSIQRAFAIEEDGGNAYGMLEYNDGLYVKDVILVSDVYLMYSEPAEVEFVTKSMSLLYKGDILNFMAGMDFSCNNLTGDIPPELGALTAIRALNLSHNQLTGSIPNSLSNLNQLESMDLSHNRLTGEIPSELIDINALAVFIVAYNNLTGKIPDKAQFSTFGITSYEGNQFLCGPPLQHQCKTGVPGTTTVIEGSEKINTDHIAFITSFVATHIVFLLGFVVLLCTSPYCRQLWFNFINACLSFMFPFWSKAIYK